MKNRLAQIIRRFCGTQLISAPVMLNKTPIHFKSRDFVVIAKANRMQLWCDFDADNQTISKLTAFLSKMAVDCCAVKF